MAKNFLIAVLFLAFLAPFACKESDIETISMQNVYGQTERYQRRKKDFAKEGLYQRFHQDGHLVEEAEYSNDTLHGARKFYFPNGQVERIDRFKHGVMHGVFQQFYEDGQIYLEQEFVDGVMTGRSTAWYQNGQKKEMVTIRNNEENGPFTEWYENGKLKAEGNYLDGDNEHGTLKLYDTLGQLERILECQRGACNTTWERPSSTTGKKTGPN